MIFLCLVNYCQSFHCLSTSSDFLCLREETFCLARLLRTGYLRIVLGLRLLLARLWRKHVWMVRLEVSTKHLNRQVLFNRRKILPCSRVWYRWVIHLSRCVLLLIANDLMDTDLRWLVEVAAAILLLRLIWHERLYWLILWHSNRSCSTFGLHRTVRASLWLISKLLLEKWKLDDLMLSEHFFGDHVT